ncbi:MAG TPA: hypothetical protein VF629_14260 [Hymenobacter sp.]|jgi:hypothetical protein|uniref:hypothetical protein n=1 Tax=Hymenobacter sp. TaxID=1898978 RepID=UPI002EDA0A8B
MAIDPNNRPIRVINDDTTNEEMEAGHHIPNADPPKNEEARGGFGNRDGKEGFGTDSANGDTAISVNANADRLSGGLVPDNIRTPDGLLADRPNQDMPAEDELTGSITPSGQPVDELDLHDRRPGVDEMLNPNSRVGMGQMEPRPIQPITGTDTNAELNDPNATDTAIDQ